MHQAQWSPERPLPPPVSLASQSHHEKPPEATCTSRGNPGRLQDITGHSFLSSFQGLLSAHTRPSTINISGSQEHMPSGITMTILVVPCSNLPSSSRIYYLESMRRFTLRPQSSPGCCQQRQSMGWGGGGGCVLELSQPASVELL